MDKYAIIKLVNDSIQSGDTNHTMELIEKFPEHLHMATVYGTCLHQAAEIGNLELVKRLLKRGADIDNNGSLSGGTALEASASAGQIEIVKYLLTQGAMIDVCEPERNPLYGAIYEGRLDVVKVLLDHGMDPLYAYHSPRRGGHMDALSYARERGQTAIANYIKTRIASA